MVAWNPWLTGHQSSLFLHHHILLCVSLLKVFPGCLCLFSYSSKIYQSYWIRAHPNRGWPHLNLITSTKTLLPNKVTVTNTEGQDFKNISGENWNWNVQSCPTLCNPTVYSLPGSCIRGILQARILEWVAIPSLGDLPDPGIEPRSPALKADALVSEPPGLGVRVEDGTHTIQHMTLRIRQALKVDLFLTTCLILGISWTVDSASLKWCAHSVDKGCPTLYDPMDYTTPGSSVHGISQERILEWVRWLALKLL